MCVIVLQTQMKKYECKDRGLAGTADYQVIVVALTHDAHLRKRRNQPSNSGSNQVKGEGERPESRGPAQRWASRPEPRNPQRRHTWSWHMI